MLLHHYAVLTGLSHSESTLESGGDTVLTSKLDVVVDTNFFPILQGRILEKVLEFYSFLSITVGKCVCPDRKSIESYRILYLKCNSPI